VWPKKPKVENAWSHKAALARHTHKKIMDPQGSLCYTWKISICIWTNDSRLLQESNLAARQPQGAISVIQAITGEGLAQGPYLAARGGVEPTTFCSTDNLHLTNHAPKHHW